MKLKVNIKENKFELKEGTLYANIGTGEILIYKEGKLMNLFSAYIVTEQYIKEYLQDYNIKEVSKLTIDVEVK